MQSKFRNSFLKDAEKIVEKRIAEKIEQAILNVEEAKNLQEINHLKKMKGGKSA